MMRAVLLASAALLAAPAAAQDHSAHGSHQSDKSAVAKPEPAMDHCAMGHLPPEQCPPKDGAAEHAAMDHSAMDHSAVDHSAHRSMPTAEDHSMHGQPDHSQKNHGSKDHSDRAHQATAEDHSAHAQMDHGAMNHGAAAQEPMDHAAMGHGTMDKSAPGAASESTVPSRAFAGPQHAADAIWGADSMAPARKANHETHGTMTTGMVMVERLEARIPVDGGETGFLWDGQAWYGGDIDKIFFKTEGEGEFGGSVEDAEVQLLWSRAIAPFWDLQAGARLDIEPETRSHLAFGVQGLAPYMFHVDAAAFLSDRGDLTARIEGEYDQKITQRLILQPRMEVELSAQDIPEREIGAGITKIEPGLRLRYEIAREFAPYVGIEYEAKLGETADIARANGDDPDGFKFLVGVRAWF